MRQFNMRKHDTFVSAGGRLYIDQAYIADQTKAPSTDGWFHAVMAHITDTQGERPVKAHGCIMWPVDAIEFAFKEVQS